MLVKEVCAHNPNFSESDVRGINLMLYFNVMCMLKWEDYRNEKGHSSYLIVVCMLTKSVCIK